MLVPNYSHSGLQNCLMGWQRCKKRLVNGQLPPIFSFWLTIFIMWWWSWPVSFAGYLFYYDLVEILLSDLELFFLEFKVLQNSQNKFVFFLSVHSLLVVLQSLYILTLSTFCTFPIASGTKEKTKSFNFTSNTFCCEI